MKHQTDPKKVPPKGQPSAPKPQREGAPGTAGTSTHKQ
jgi:hypothetical protein